MRDIGYNETPSLYKATHLVLSNQIDHRQQLEVEEEKNKIAVRKAMIVRTYKTI